MSYIRSFEISNFKGIKYVEINIPQQDGLVTTLLGLNESGKTSILEAISHFGLENEVVSSVFNRVYKAENASSFIPIVDKAAFDGKISISANVVFEQKDFEMMSVIAKEKRLRIRCWENSAEYSYRKNIHI